MPISGTCRVSSIISANCWSNKVAAALANLANVLGSRHKYSDAEELLHRAEEIDRRSFSAQHPRIAYDLSVEAALLFDRKQYARAETVLSDAMAILLKSFPATHPQIG